MLSFCFKQSVVFSQNYESKTLAVLFPSWRRKFPSGNFPSFLFSLENTLYQIFCMSAGKTFSQLSFV